MKPVRISSLKVGTEFSLGSFNFRVVEFPRVFGHISAENLFTESVILIPRDKTVFI